MIQSKTAERAFDSTTSLRPEWPGLVTSFQRIMRHPRRVNMLRPCGTGLSSLPLGECKRRRAWWRVQAAGGELRRCCLRLTSIAALPRSSRKQ